MISTFGRPGNPLGSTVLFLGGGREWTAADAVTAAAARGALDDAARETLAAYAAEEWAEHENLEIDEEELQQRSERYRYEHDLISAGETEEWLAARGMTVDDFTEWLYGRLCVEKASGLGPRASDDQPKDFGDRLLIHLWLSGEMERVTEDFRRRIAAHIEIAEANVSPDAAHDRLARTVLGDAGARRRKLEMERLPLTRLQIESLDVDSEAAAREACLCVREDGQTLAQVAAGAGYATKREELWTEEAGRTLGSQVSFASDGELVGPLRIANGFKVCQIIRRIEPALADAEVAARVDSMLLDEYFNELCARHTQLPVIART